MGKINVSRVLIGGIVAGLVADVLAYAVDGMLLAPQWASGMKALGHSEFSSTTWVGFNLIGLVGGIATIWIYAGIRPRFGAGAKTAVFAGLVAWLMSSLLPNLAFMWFGDLFSHQLTSLTTLGALVEIVAGAIAGAALYQEAAA
jgi:hypothetical protein